jgi:hypothetical protein
MFVGTGAHYLPPTPLLRASVAALLVAGALPGCAVFPHSSNPPGDQKITADIETRFHQHADLEPPNILEVQTISRVVYLHGMVSTELQRRDAESVAKEV